MSEDSVTKRLEKYKEGIKDNFTVLIEKTFPEKILELTDLLESDKFSIQRLESIHTPIAVEPLFLPPGGENDGTGGATSSDITPNVTDLTKKFIQLNAFHMLLPPEGRVRCNKHVQELIDIVKTLQYELLQHTSQIKIAITYLVPKVEDGNNFGVEIQEETVKIIKGLESDLKTEWKEFSSFSGYYKDRARFANDICREPFLDDNREGIRRLDERAFLFLVDLVTFIRDAYGKMHDVITKNIEKIRKPRTSNADSLSN